MNQPNHGGNLAWAATVAGCPAFSLLDFSASINPLGPSAPVIEAIQRAFPQLCHYPDPDYGALRQALAQHHGVDPDRVLPGNGSAELLTLAGRTLASETATVLVIPAFSDYFRTIKGVGGEISPCVWEVTQPFPLSQLLSLGSPQRSLILNNPHNPTGHLLRRDEILPLLSQFAWVVIDEAFMDFLPASEQESLIPQLEQYPNLIILRSLTKFHSLPGLRLGYALANPALLRQWQSWRDPWPVNVLAEAAAIAALGDKDFEAQTWDWLPPTRAKLWQGLNNIPGLSPRPSRANFLLIKTKIAATRLQHYLLQQHRLLIRDCLSFAELGDDYFRVAVRKESENQRLVAALTQALDLNSLP